MHHRLWLLLIKTILQLGTMIRNFEYYTHEMTPEENQVIMPWILRTLTLAIGKDKAIKNATIVKDFNAGQMQLYLEGHYDKIIKTRTSRVRKLIHILRVSDTIPMLLAGAKGYYISDDKEEIKTYIGSIEDRIRAIYQIRRALKRQLTKSREAQEGVQTKLVLE